MKHMRMDQGSTKTFLSGVYLITFPNGKKYIGISNNIYRRMLEHNHDFRNNLPIEHAIKKYGKVAEYDILEFIPANNRDLMREREKYWISYYQSNQREFGYNISEGGDGADLGSNNHEAKLTEDDIQDLYDLLKNRIDLSFQELCNMYHINISTLSHINNGHTYFHPNVEYPIRSLKDTRQRQAGTKGVNSKFSDAQVQEIIGLLRDTDIPMNKIAERYNVWPGAIQGINNGKHYIFQDIEYPIRKNHTSGAKKLTTEVVRSFIQDIKMYPNESLASLGKKYGINRKSVSQINLGQTYKQPDEIYPIRKK